MDAGTHVQALLTALTAEVRQAVRDELAAQGDARSAEGWLSLDSAAAYLDSKPEALRAAEKRGQLLGHRSATGRLRFLRADLDAFSVAGDVAA